MNNLSIKSLTRSLTTLSVATESPLLYRNYGRVIDTIEVPEGLERFNRPHRRQPTHARKRRVVRLIQTRANLRLKEHQKPISNWRNAPQNHLPKFDESKVKPKIDYKARVDQRLDEPFGWRKRQEQREQFIKQKEEEFLSQLRVKRSQREEELQRMNEAKREALEARRLQQQQQTLLSTSN
ncbi:hypothetical protein SAMD00019534_040530 [Acytostelium subglobosum LB1]|uniref:hypothetical protein n=1 Tax=Acytostelium subglobosum LB1 TaxID=1410327 RepID=UPI0006450EAC|nr:hypothetical protein SAMD00019534_040530 [Acytostelium subglobosum LB1]GAM20878.1 hypothetical protein SAMD00019534_040530 [Acytostelium subglobosum LB1]|eukprot:XP_012756012.1 hypothetical protein SAMD00019534_040530 [Acytostelium subglobosum LB1]